MDGREPAADGDPATAGRDRARAAGRRALAVCLALLAVPWSLQVYPSGEVIGLFAWGLAGSRPFTVVLIHEYLFVYTAGLPRYILAWPTGVLLWAGAAASAGVGALTGREDVRVTAGLLALAGLLQVTVAQGFGVQPGRTALPTGTAALWAAAAYVYFGRNRKG